MTTIISKNDFKIIRDTRKNNIYTIDFEPSINNETLINSIIKTRIILGTTSTNNFQTLIFKATSVKTLDQMLEEIKIQNNTRSLSYPTILKMIYDLVTQLNYLITTNSHTFLGYNSENIIVIDDNKFIHLTNEYLKEIDPITETIQISYPFSETDFFLSPELLKIKEIPANIHYKTSYFSFATLILYAFTGTNNFESINDIEDNKEQEDTKEKEKEKMNKPLDEKMNNYLDSLYIKDSQLYWLLKKCLKTDPKSRTIQFL